MTPIESTVAVLNRWCGEDAVDHTDEKLEDLWNRTKPTGKPSHSGIDFFEQGAEDLVDRLTAWSILRIQPLPPQTSKRTARRRTSLMSSGDYNEIRCATQLKLVSTRKDKKCIVLR
jgi:hypothetical protein